VPAELCELAARALDLARRSGASDAIAAASDGVATDFACRDGKLEKVQASGSRSLGLQLWVDRRWSTHATSDLRPAELARFVADAVALTRELEPDPFRLIPDPALYAGRANVELELFDPQVEKLSRERCLDWLGAMDTAAHADSRVISATSHVSFRSSASARLSTNGFAGETRSSGMSFGAEVTLDEGNGRRPEGYRFVGARWLEDLPPADGIARQALERARERIGSRKAPSARAALVVHREAAGRLLGFVLGALSAGAIQQRRSFLAERKGQPVASELLDVVDDPLLVRGLGSHLWDGEGIAARRRPIVARGVLADYYVDTYYGRKLGWAPTTGGPSNLIFSPGARDLPGLIADAGDGFLATSWIGGNADATSGDFSIGMRGNRIERGAIGAPVSEMNVSGNLLELWRNLIAVGNDPYPWASLRTPSLVFRNVDLSGE
jgi:PmbA protein